MEQNSFLQPETEEQRREFTSTITNRLLRYGIGDKVGYEKEVGFIEGLFGGLSASENKRRGFEALKIFLPGVPEEILNRYSAIKHEVENAGLDNLIIGACGLSPLGLVLSSSHPELTVYDTDLPDLAGYRKSLAIGSPSNYHIEEWDLLYSELPDFIERKEGKTGIVVEGLTFYLDEEQRHKFNSNLQMAAKQLSEKPVTWVFDYHISPGSARERDVLRMPDHPEWQYFIEVMSEAHANQNAFFKSRADVKQYLESEGFSNVRISEASGKDNAHTIFVCEYGGG